MTIEEILQDFRSAVGHFPRAALEAAVAQREEITPELLRIIEVAAQAPSAASRGPNGFLPTFATYLLAQFRDQRAFPLIIKMVTGPGDSAHEVLGESITMDLGRILASVYDGSLAALKQVIEDLRMDGYVRSGVLDTLLHLVRSQQMSREDLVGYLRYLLRPEAQRDGSYIWDAIIGVAVELPALELLEHIRSLFEDDRLCIQSYMDAEEVKEEMDRSKQDKSEVGESLITDVISEMSWWACFEPREPSAEESENPDEDWFDEAKEPLLQQQEQVNEPLPLQNYVPPTPHVRESPKIGRNDPCPCASGKKYKKCCGR